MRTVLLLVLAAFTVAGCERGTPLQVEMKKSGTHVVVTYNGPMHIGKCRLHMNGGYNTKVSRINSGQSVAVPFSRFATTLGRPYRSSIKVEKMAIICEDVPDGIYDYSSFHWN